MKDEQLKIIDCLKNKQGQGKNMPKNNYIDVQLAKDFLLTNCKTKKEAEDLLYERSEELYALRVFLEDKGLTAEAERYLDKSFTVNHFKSQSEQVKLQGAE